MIHYHGTRLSGDRLTTIRALSGKHAMISYADTADLEIIAEVCQTFCFDNGAFTTWKQGKEFDMEGYAAWVEQWIRHPAFDFYVIPDVIDGTPEEGMRLIAKWRGMTDHNMLTHGAPVWHMHEPLEVLARFCQAYQRVCLGSSGEYAAVGNDKWWGRMAEAMTVACDEQGRPKAKLHGLRMLDPTVFSHLPLSSADSTNVARNIGIDQAWKGTYTPKSREARAMILMERIEAHCSASRWNGDSAGTQQNLELFG
jgi:hypothetical protein